LLADRQPARKGTDHRAAHRAFLRQLTAGGDYVPLKRRYARALGLSATALVLQVSNVAQAKADDAGFIWAEEEFIENGIGLGPKGQERALAKLQALKIAEVEFRGGRRYVRLDLDRLQQVVEERLAAGTTTK
jgi:hypothetical protein